jgi:hypothetical protein
MLSRRRFLDVITDPVDYVARSISSSGLVLIDNVDNDWSWASRCQAENGIRQETNAAIVPCSWLHHHLHRPERPDFILDRMLGLGIELGVDFMPFVVAAIAHDTAKRLPDLAEVRWLLI